MKPDPRGRCSWRQSRREESHAVPTQVMTQETCPHSWINVWFLFIFSRWTNAPLGFLRLSATFFDFPASWNLFLGWRHVLENNCSLHVKMCSVFRILEARRLEVFAAQRWKRLANWPTLSLFCCIHQQYTWSTLPENCKKKNMFETYKLTNRTWM